MDTPRSYTTAEKVRVVVFVLLSAGVLLTIAALPTLLDRALGGQGRVSASAVTTQHLALDIMPVKVGGPADNWPAYVASTSLSVPANSVVTVTIRNFDLGDAALTPNSPLARVQGTIDGVAVVDGKSYTALDPAKVSHTFTVPSLGLNVPIPGDAPSDATYLTVTFSFRTHGAGAYVFECLAPCGTGTGFDGPMQSMAYMKGTVTVR